MKSTINSILHNKIVIYLIIIINIVFIGDFFIQFTESFFTNWDDFLNSNIKVIQDLIVIFAVISLFTEVNLKNLLIAYPLAILETKVAFFNTFIHPLLLDMDIYSLFSKQPNEISPDLIRVIFLFSILLIYFIRLFFNRNYKIIFLTLGMSGVLFTALLFHTITLTQLNFYTHAQEKIFKQFNNDVNLDIVKSKCEMLGIECYLRNEHKSIFDNKAPKLILMYKENIEPAFNSSDIYFYYTIASNPEFDDRISSRTPVAFIKTRYFELGIVDYKNYTEYLKLNQLLFGVLAFFSHVVWAFGSLYLIYFHNKRMKRKNTVNS